MKKLLLIFVASILGWSDLLARDEIGKGDVVVVPVKGEISPPVFMFVRRAVKTAESNGASAIIIEMNTHGGRLDSAEEITNVLNQTRLPTYTFINTNAGSAGAIIALATQHIFMAPVSAIGAAAPVLASGQELPVTMRDKTISYWSGMTRGSATKNGHNPDIGEAFINKDKEVKIGERLIHGKGTLLTLSAQEAVEVIDGKPLLARGTADTVEAVVTAAKITGKISRLEPTGFEQLASWITALAPALLLLGILCAYLEFKIPGVSLPGIISAICFALFFFGHFIAGLAGWEVVGLFVLGVVFVIIEILFFAHSSVIFGVAGALLILASILWAMIDRYPGQTFMPTGDMLAVPLRNLALALLAAMVAIPLMAKYLPRTSLYQRFALGTSIPPGPSLSAPRHFENVGGILPGAHGVALTVLRPSGKAQFGANTVDVTTNGEFIGQDVPVEVVEADGMKVVVRAIATPV